MIQREVEANIPTDEGNFRLVYYSNDVDGKEHIALTLGEVKGKENVPVRIHSECFTGDTLGSRRCDCREQLRLAKKFIAERGEGVIIYLRQEGRGIGLLNKLKAYNLQDQGLDTVDANLELGRGSDEREYSLATEMLKELGVESVQLMTNNPDKISAVEQSGLEVTGRIPMEAPITNLNRKYLSAKQQRMNHLINISGDSNYAGDTEHIYSVLHMIQRAINLPASVPGRPEVTLTYAQSMDGSIAFEADKQLTISCPEAMTLTHGLRTIHDAIIVGIGTVLSDNPELTARHFSGPSPQPIVIDSQLRMPLEAKLLSNPPVLPIVATTEDAPDEKRKTLEDAGARILTLPANQRNRVDLSALLEALDEINLHRVMVEGGARIITSFLTEQLVDNMILTIAPHLLGGLRGVRNLNLPTPVERPHLENLQHRQVGKDLIVWGKVNWGAV